MQTRHGVPRNALVVMCSKISVSQSPFSVMETLFVVLQIEICVMEKSVPAM